MHDEYVDGLTLGRIDNNKGYCKENCRWETFIQQANNKRNVPLININGEQKSVAEWSRISGINPGTIWSRLNRFGWNAEMAVFTPSLFTRKGAKSLRAEVN